ncbi:MAG TPA: signal peptide peptidase SppA [Chitinophaga sp.]|nr:signal peptide peptidase SppA [Chitinophaga sp.]
MKQFFKIFFASLLALFVAGILFFILFFGAIGALVSSVSKEEAIVIKDNSVLMLDLGAPLHETGKANVLSAITGNPANDYGLNDVLNSIREAKGDNKIKGIYLKATGSPNGWATAQQLRAALKEFKLSRKFIYAYGDFITQKDYYVTSVADSIFINPLGMVELKGLASQLAFFKGTLDKLEVKPEIFYCGQFKSATEPFRMNKMSEPNRKQQAALQADIWNGLLQAVSEKTKADTATIFSWAKNGTIQTGADAVSYKLADGMRYKDEVEALLLKSAGLKADDKVRLATITDYSKSLSSGKATDQIALLVAEGEIIDGKGSSSGYEIAAEKFIKEIRKVKNNDKIKAVVMRVNSPGGSALASEVILRELQLLRKKKPLVVSMGDVAASGGYYISCQADSIFAMPNTITGSIGVFGMLFNTQAFFNNKLGVTFDGEKNAPYADFPNLNRSMTDKEKTFIQNSVDSIYLTFKRRVAAGRKVDVQYVDSIGQGRVWTGSAALKNRLVDGLGGFDRAFKSAATLAKLKEYKVVTYPAPKDQVEQIMQMLKGSNDDQALVQRLMQQEMSEEYKLYRMLNKFRENKNHIWMVMPYVPEIQ